MFELLSIPAIILAVEAVKRARFLPSRYCAILAVLFGGIFGYTVGAVVGGLILGLSASGLYSGAKAVLNWE